MCVCVLLHVIALLLRKKSNYNPFLEVNKSSDNLVTSVMDNIRAGLSGSGISRSFFVASNGNLDESWQKKQKRLFLYGCDGGDGGAF